MSFFGFRLSCEREKGNGPGGGAGRRRKRQCLASCEACTKIPCCEIAVLCIRLSSSPSRWERNRISRFVT